MSHRSDKKEWTALVAAFLLFAAALLVVSPAEASRTTTDARSNLAPSSSLELPPLGPVEPIDPVESSPHFGFGENLGLLDPKAGPGGFVVFAVGTAQCELTYARNNPLRFTDPTGALAEDGNKPPEPEPKPLPPPPKPAPTRPDGRPEPPPVLPPPGASGQPNEWVYVPNQAPSPGQRPGRWKPRERVPNPKGAQPSASWDPDGHWDIDTPSPTGGKGDRQRFLPDGTAIGPDHRPLRGGSSSFVLDPRIARDGAMAIGTGAFVYWFISEGSRIVFPPRNLVPIP